MQVVYEHCAGIDVHKKTVVVTVLRTDMAGKTSKTTRTFTTMTADLRALSSRSWYTIGGTGTRKGGAARFPH